MKQLIVMCSMIFLGIAIYYLIMGEQEDSLINKMAEFWKRSLEVRSYTE